MKTFPAACIAFLMGLAALPAAEFFVSKQGNDAHDGTTWERAFLTVQKGVDALSAGDTLTIGPGEYAESVTRNHLGSEEKETVIRAEIPRTAILRGDVQVGRFKKTQGYRFVYETGFDRNVQAVNELDTLEGLRRMPNLAELDAAPGRWLYDAAAKRLYVSASDWLPVDQHVYRVSVIQGDGLFLESPRRVVVDGLVVTGFNSATHGKSSLKYRDANAGLKVVWGILFHQSQGSVIRSCTAYLNGGGIGVNNAQNLDPALVGKGNLVENCVAYGNFFQASAYEASGVGVYGPNNDEIRNCYTYNNGAFGTRMYGRVVAPSKIAGSLAWGNFGNLGDFQLKVGAAGASIHNSVSLGGFTNIMDSKNCITGREDQPFPKDNISLSVQNEPRVDFDREFADPENYDFRLQSDSRFRGSGPDGNDRGPHPYEANIFYVSTKGDDGADGLSMRTPWKTLARATKQLRPGDTVYLEGGEYQGGVDLELEGSETQPIAIRGRGANPVKIVGEVRISDGAHFNVQRIHFADAVRVASSHDVVFEHCGFSAKKVGLLVDHLEDLKIAHCQLTGFSEAGLAMRSAGIKKSAWASIKAFFGGSSSTVSGSGRNSGVYLSGNIFDNAGAPAVELGDADEVSYSEYNGYRDMAKSWKREGDFLTREQLQARHDKFSSEVVVTFVEKDGVPVAEKPIALVAGGPMGKPLGPYRDRMERNVLRVTSAPEVHSVSATTANVEWTTSMPATCELAWGETPECANTESFDVNHFGTFSLTGLKPGQTYYFRLKSLSVPTALDRIIEADPVTLNGETLSFTTLKTNAAPAVYYVAPDGDNAQSGTSRQTAWKTLVHAASKLNAGDTVLIASGTYPERVRLRATGDENAPITFKALAGEKVVINGAGSELNNAFVATGKSFLAFDGLYFTEFNIDSEQGWNPGRSGEFNLYRGRNISITRCFSDGRGGYTAALVTAWFIENLLIKNCVLVNKFQGMSFTGPCPNLRIENNVFAGTMVMHVVLGNRENAPASMENNIFTDNIPVKASGNIPLFNMGDYTVNRNNCYYLRNFFSPDKRTPYGPGKAFADHQKEGTIVDPLFANPRFAGVAVPDPKFKPSYDMGYPLDDSPDRMMSPDVRLDFADFFATDPEVVRRGIGLVPAEFQGMHTRDKTAAGVTVKTN